MPPKLTAADLSPGEARLAYEQALTKHHPFTYGTAATKLGLVLIRQGEIDNALNAFEADADAPRVTGLINIANLVLVQAQSGNSAYKDNISRLIAFSRELEDLEGARSLLESVRDYMRQIGEDGIGEQFDELLDE